MDDAAGSPPARTTQPDGFVIGIAASAGGLEAISQLLNALPEDTGATFIIAQHLSPTHKSLMSTLLSRETKMPVVEIHGEVVPKQNHIYLAPPNTDVIMKGGTFSQVEPDTHPGTPKPSANRLFVSLAQEMGDHAIGIVLSGTGSDGSYGIQAIREHGGITIAQDVASAKYDGMPVAAAETGCVDLVLSPTQIGQHIVKILSMPRDLEALAQINENPSQMADLLQILLARTRVDFREYKDSTIQRRITRRRIALGIDDYDDYVAYCRSNTPEVDALYKDLLISVTRFFRDADEFAALRPLIQELVNNNRDRQPIRVWVAGCATGEEAYSLAILFAEALGGPEKLSKDRLQIFATDIDAQALDRARDGIYPLAALADVPDRLRDDYFELRDSTVAMIPALRSVILFTTHNVIQDPPFINIDLVSLRNLLIYFNSRLQERVLNRIHHALTGRGLLFLGRSETIGALDAAFEPLSPMNRSFRKRAIQRAGQASRDRLLAAEFSHWSGSRRAAAEPAPPDELHRDMFEALARSVGPDALLVTSQHDIMRVFGNVTPYIELSEQSMLDLRLNLLRRPLREEARSLVTIALRRKEAKKGLVQQLDGTDITAQLTAYPIALPRQGEEYVLLAIHQVESREIPILENEEGREKDERLHQLQADVAYAREALQQTVEELQTSNEELQSVNEELQSTNEELQASNEELETSNEELQSTNEELITVNEELQVNSAELGAVTAELETILDAAPLAVIVVNSALQITRASAAAKRFFALPDDYFDLHLSACAVPDEFPNLIEVASRVFTSRAVVDVPFSAGKAAYSLTCIPYATAAGQIRGVNLVLTEVESARAHDARLAQEQMHIVAELGTVAAFSVAGDGAELMAGQGLARVLATKGDTGPWPLADFYAAFSPDDAAAVQAAIEAAQDNGNGTNLTARTASGEHPLRLTIRTRSRADGGPPLVYGVASRYE